MGTRRAGRMIALSMGLAAMAGCSGMEPMDEEAGLDDTEAHGDRERYLYIATLSKSTTDPDFLTVVGVQPGRSDFGRIIRRVDMPNVGDELHHFGYSLDQERLVVPGLFSGRVHIFDVDDEPDRPKLKAVNTSLLASSGYAVPHSLTMMPGGQFVATMIGSTNADSTPGGIVQLNDRTGAFAAYFGPGPNNRPPGTLGPKYMYDVDSKGDADRMISTTFGPPALCGPGLDPTCLGNEVAVWSTSQRRVIQVADLGTNSGALEVRFIEKPGVRRALINTPGTSAVWLADDDDKNGAFDFQQVLGPEDGLLIVADMLLSYDNKFMILTNWFGNTIQVYDITDPYNPIIKSEVPVPHPNMLRLSRDNKRLYVTNSLLTSWDDDPDFGPPRNNEYGLWQFNMNTSTGALSSITSNGSAWVSFTNVQKLTTTGPAGPHMMFFDPGVRLTPGEH